MPISHGFSYVRNTSTAWSAILGPRVLQSREWWWNMGREVFFLLLHKALLAFSRMNMKMLTESWVVLQIRHQQHCLGGRRRGERKGRLREAWNSTPPDNKWRTSSLPPSHGFLSRPISLQLINPNEIAVPVHSCAIGCPSSLRLLQRLICNSHYLLSLLPLLPPLVCHPFLFLWSHYRPLPLSLPLSHSGIKQAEHLHSIIITWDRLCLSDRKRKGKGNVGMLLGFKQSIQQVNSRLAPRNLWSYNHGMLIIGFPIFSPRPQTKSIGETGTVVDITKDVFFRGAHFEHLSQIQQDCAILIETAGSVFGRNTKRQCDVKLLQPKVRRMTAIICFWNVC